ncbi:MAG: HAMP domain-containing histidine kinase [Gammaproteobacteria bacterium]|nr:HAMP domain-containing histidine kinase [Gammaproteobacteria bacterium]MDH3856806.1 HAMP domain-containing histidine kinase [Gammaproteobacteria bacterium]
MWSYLQARWQSLIFRLLFYFLVSMLALAVILGISFAQRIKPHVQNEILPNVERYIEYLIEDIGNPPDLATAQQLAEQLPFEIRIEGQGIDWSSSPGLKAIAVYEFEPAPRPYDNVYLSHHRRDQFLLIQKQDYRYLFSVDNGFRRGSERRHWVLFLLLGSILLFLYFVIRRMFRPIEAMSRQVKKIGEGDLEQRIETGGKGELELLAAGINDMSEQIKAMLEGKSALLLAISHELRSPITRMRVNLELLEPDEVQQKLIDDLREMETLIASILESEKLNSGHAPLALERCDMSSLIEEVIKDHPCRERIRTRMNPIEVRVDPMRIKLLIKNLVDNACQHAGEDRADININLSLEQGMVRLEVQDHGPGLDPGDIPRLTEAFYRPDSSRQRNTGGYGLGLYLCKLIVDAHAGQITIESEPGNGTGVIVILPIDNS